jgi:hypothetical protein
MGSIRSSFYSGNLRYAGSVPSLLVVEISRHLGSLLGERASSCFSFCKSVFVASFLGRFIAAGCALL